MTADSRKNRILELIIDKVFGSINQAGDEELNVLLNHPEEDREEWEKLLASENLIDFIVANFNDSQAQGIDLDAAKAKFRELLNKDKNI